MTPSAPGRLLIVDDDRFFREVLREALRGEAVQITEAATAREALLQLERQRFDAVLCDLILPDLTGIEVLSTSRERQPSASFVLLTVSTSMDAVNEAVRRGAFGYLFKPLRPEEVREVVRRAVRRARGRGWEAGLPETLPPQAELVGGSPQMQAVLRMLPAVAAGDLPVLIQGETGTGKEVTATNLHYRAENPRRALPLLRIPCGAVPELLFESEFFGYRRGAFTGAHRDKVGLLETAAGGTLFFDEVAEMTPAMQAKLLRFLQDGTFLPLGDTEVRRINVRVFAATNRDLREEVRKGGFREDLYFRLKGVLLKLPPLRDRREDIPHLTEFFLRRYSPRLPRRFSPDAARILHDHAWPGNVRELENEIRRTVDLAGSAEVLGAEALSPDLKEAAHHGPALNDEGLWDRVSRYERDEIARALEVHRWNRSQTARALGISRGYLLKKIALFGLDRRASSKRTAKLARRPPTN